MLGELYRDDGLPLSLCPRGALRRAEANWLAHGLSPKIGTELEAFAFTRTPDGPIPYDTPAARFTAPPISPILRGSTMRSGLRQNARGSGWT